MSDVSDGKTQNVVKPENNILKRWEWVHQRVCGFLLWVWFTAETHLQNWSLLLFTSWPELLESVLNLIHFWFDTFETSESTVFWSCSETMWWNVWIFEGCCVSVASPWFLHQFLVCMVIGCLLMLRTGIPAAVARPKVTRRRSAVALNACRRTDLPDGGVISPNCHLCTGDFTFDGGVRHSQIHWRLFLIHWRQPHCRLSCRQIESMLMLMLTQLLLLRHIKRLQLDKQRLAFIVKQQQEMQKTRRQTFC